MPVKLRTPGEDEGGENVRPHNCKLRRGEDDPENGLGDDLEDEPQYAPGERVSRAELARVRIEPEAFRRIPLVLQTEFNVLPFMMFPDALLVLVGERSEETRQRLESFTGLRIVQVPAVAAGIPAARRRALETL